jgi:3-oxoacyl-[acyl-carrier protein] reductase
MRDHLNLLLDKVAIVTGSARGIGAATAALFAAQGAKVVITDIDAVQISRTAERLRGAGYSILEIVADVTKPEQVQNLVDQTIKGFGSVDILVNNAGFTWDGMLHKMSDQQWQAILDVHLTAPFRLIRAAAPYMRETAKQEVTLHGVTKSRKIINISSTTGTRGKVGQVNYAAAKAGIIGLTRTLAKEWGPFNVQVNAVAFGMIDTRLTRRKDGNEHVERNGQRIDLGIPEEMRQTAVSTIPMGRAGTPEEAAGPLLFFASELSNYVSGQVLEVTGGL